MSNKNSPSEKRIPWRKRISWRESILERLRADGVKNLRDEATQVEFIVEEYYMTLWERENRNG